MPLACPKCGSRHLRPSRCRSVQETIDSYRFISPLRCRDCNTRFVSRTIFPEDIFYAHCPKCDRMDLNRWTGKTFKPEGWLKFKVALGAKGWRCEYCRLNFASFRARKEIFTFSRWKTRNPDSVAEKSSAADPARRKAGSARPGNAPQAPPPPKTGT